MLGWLYDMFVWLYGMVVWLYGMFVWLLVVWYVVGCMLVIKYTVTLRSLLLLDR